MFQKFTDHINNNLPFLKSGKLLLALSGGVDSVVLAYLCKNAGLNIAFAHCNFKLREEESDKDEQFVEALGVELDVETFRQSFDTSIYAKSNKLSIQVAARELRYQWFEELSQQLEFDYILTAHHADDNLETFLINLSRGTGLEGLTGIPEINDTVVRPLLCFSREEIINYAHEAKISWREDASNASVKYLRNKLRHEVIPILKGINPQLLHNFDKTISHLKESQTIVDAAVHDISKEVITEKGGDLYINIKKIKSLRQPKAYLYELLKTYGFTEWNDVVNLLEAQTGKIIYSEHWRLIRDRKELILSPKVLESFKAIEVNESDTEIQLPIGNLHIEKVNTIEDTNSSCVYVNADSLKFPLAIRVKEKGDAFFPLGMKGKKKLSKYFKDEKMSLVEKEKTLLLCSGDTIIWVIGKRGDNRFRVEHHTKNILKLSLV